MAQNLSAMDLYAANLEHARRVASRYLNIAGVQSAEIYALTAEALWDAALAFEGKEGNFEAYATTAIQNRLNDLARKVRKQNEREVVVEPGSQIFDQRSAGNPVVDSIEEVESNAALGEILQGLPEREREVLIRSANGESFSQIGKDLGVSKQMVGKISANARVSARASIEESRYNYDGRGMLSSQAALADRCLALEELKDWQDCPRPRPRKPAGVVARFFNRLFRLFKVE